MTLMTMLILVLVYAVAAVLLFGIFAGIPMWMIRTHPDTAPDNKLPQYLRPTGRNLPERELAGAGQRPGR
jgi:hypothetical protein